MVLVKVVVTRVHTYTWNQPTWREFFSEPGITSRWTDPASSLIELEEFLA